MTEISTGIKPAEWLDIHPPLLFINNISVCGDKSAISYVDIVSLIKASLTHLPLSGSPIPLSLISETMLQASALTIYAYQRQCTQKALVFSAKTRLFSNITSNSLKPLIYTDIVFSKRKIIKTNAILKVDDKVYASGNFEYLSGIA